MMLPGDSLAGMRVLVIDDERPLAGVPEYNLRREGYVVTLAHDGLEGLQKAQTLLLGQPYRDRSERRLPFSL
jgi:CheY-like chemotaxis protein